MRSFPSRTRTTRLRQAWGLSDKFVVGYSGNLGRTHEFLTMLAVSERFKKR